MMTGGVFAVLLGPAVVGLVTSPPGPLPLAGMLAAVAALMGLFIRLAALRVDPAGGHRGVPWLELGTFVVLAAGVAARGSSWVPALALAALVVALHVPPALTRVVVGALTGLAGVLGWRDSGDATTAVVLMLAAGVMGGFGYSSRRSMELSAQLAATQQELAGLAVAQERLRIAGELHDLLGHSLSVIALKAELAGSLLATDPDGARGEIGDVPAALELGMSITPWAPLANGFLSGKYTRAADGVTGEGRVKAVLEAGWNREPSEQDWAVLDALTATAAELGRSPAQVALNWLAHRPGVGSTLVGVRTLGQLDDNLAALDFTLPGDHAARLEQASRPAPRFPADMAYGRFPAGTDRGVRVRSRPAWHPATTNHPDDA